VKAFSYGSGSFEIANALQFHHIDYLAVAYTDEGIELRKAGITVPVIVMNPEEESFDALIKYNLEPEIYNFRILNLLASALKSNILDYENAISIHIKFDTGMHRLGFELKDIPALIGYLHENRQFHVKSVFSHLAGSYDSKLDDFTHQQIRLFNEMCDKILPALPYPVMRHLLNSAGIVRFPDAQYDMVRPGIGLYGVPSVDAEKENLKNVSSLKTIISQIKTVTAKESIGYGREFIAQRDMKIAVLPIGYADGLSRTLSNGKGKVYVSSGQSAQNGSLAPVVGNISMDMCMIDITDIPAEEGDEVIIFGDEYPITNLAKQLGTIPYEVLTSISRRVKRIYFQE
jgi:alanine racemase